MIVTMWQSVQDRPLDLYDAARARGTRFVRGVGQYLRHDLCRQGGHVDGSPAFDIGRAATPEQLQGVIERIRRALPEMHIPSIAVQEDIMYCCAARAYGSLRGELFHAVHGITQRAE